jgi:hypothetical protein
MPVYAVFVPRDVMYSLLNVDTYSTFRHTCMILDGDTTASAIPFSANWADPRGAGDVVISYHRNDAYVVPTDVHRGTDATSEYVREGLSVKTLDEASKAISDPNEVVVWLNPITSPTAARYVLDVCGDDASIVPREKLAIAPIP